MKFALMQPYFFPYLGYFSLMSSVDYFMFFDNVQFVKKSWMTRNRLLNLSSGKAFYIRPELQNVVYKSLLPTIELKEDENWKSILLNQLGGYKKRAPYYLETEAFIGQILNTDYKGLADLNIRTTQKIAKYIDVNPKMAKYTDYDFKFDPKPGIGDWGREVAIKVEAKEYINSPGGESFIYPKLFCAHNIRLGFIQPNLKPYKQGMFDFISGLSILDVLLFNGKEKTRELVKDYSVIWKN